MNEIVNTFLLAGEKIVPEMHVKQSVLTYSACGPFTKNKKKIDKIMQSRNTDFIYWNELDKACFQHDMAYGKSKDLAKRTQSDKVLRNKVFKIVSDAKYDDSNELHQQIITKFKEEKFIHLSKTIFGVLI